VCVSNFGEQCEGEVLFHFPYPDCGASLHMI